LAAIDAAALLPPLRRRSSGSEPVWLWLPTCRVQMCKKIQKSGCNVLLVQKSILRDAVNDLSLHYLSKLKILVVKVSSL
jgi:hypothetical protein